MRACGTPPADRADQAILIWHPEGARQLAAYGEALQTDAKHLWNRQAETQLQVPVMTELIAAVVADLPELMPKAWCWWIPAQLLIFSYVPILYRLTAVMCASYCWNLYLSFEINSEKKEKTA